MNISLISGRVVAPGVINAYSGRFVINFTVAVNRGKNPDGSQKTDFVNCAWWFGDRDKAEKRQALIKKGTIASVVGQLEVGMYTLTQGQRAGEVVIDQKVQAMACDFFNVKINNGEVEIEPEGGN